MRAVAILTSFFFSGNKVDIQRSEVTSEDDVGFQPRPSAWAHKHYHSLVPWWEPLFVQLDNWTSEVTFITSVFGAREDLNTNPSTNAVPWVLGGISLYCRNLVFSPGSLRVSTSSNPVGCKWKQNDIIWVNCLIVSSMFLEHSKCLHT